MDCPRQNRTENESGDTLVEVSIRLLGIVHQDEEKLTPFCAIVWSGPPSLPSSTQVFVAGDWKEQLTAEDADYVAGILSDCKHLLRTSPSTLVDLTRQLSVGPIRTMDEVSMNLESAVNFIQQQLRHPSRLWAEC